MKKTVVSVILAMVLALTGLATGCSKDTPEPVADASPLHAVICETASDNTMMELIFRGKNVKNYGEADPFIDEEKERNEKGQETE